MFQRPVPHAFDEARSFVSSIPSTLGLSKLGARISENVSVADRDLVHLRPSIRSTHSASTRFSFSLQARSTSLHHSALVVRAHDLESGVRSVSHV
jgi:hypothetical protein